MDRSLNIISVVPAFGVKNAAILQFSLKRRRLIKKTGGGKDKDIIFWGDLNQLVNYLDN